MENLSKFQVCFFFSRRAGVYGLLARVLGQTYALGATERGIFYRVKGKISQTKQGWQTFFGLRTSVGIAQLMIRKWMKDEVVPLNFRPAGIRGSLHFSRTGIISFVGGSLADSQADSDSELFLPLNKGSY